MKHHANFDIIIDAILRSLLRFDPGQLSEAVGPATFKRTLLAAHSAFKRVDDATQAEG